MRESIQGVDLYRFAYNIVFLCVLLPIFDFSPTCILHTLTDAQLVIDIKVKHYSMLP
jgi:hypothetical protein